MAEAQAVCEPPPWSWSPSKTCHAAAGRECASPACTQPDFGTVGSVLASFERQFHTRAAAENAEGKFNTPTQLVRYVCPRQ